MEICSSMNNILKIYFLLPMLISSQDYPRFNSRHTICIHTFTSWLTRLSVYFIFCQFRNHFVHYGVGCIVFQYFDKYLLGFPTSTAFSRNYPFPPTSIWWMWSCSCLPGPGMRPWFKIDKLGLSLGKRNWV